MHEHMLFDRAGHSVALVSVAEPNATLISYEGKLYVKNATGAFKEARACQATFRERSKE